MQRFHPRSMHHRLQKPDCVKPGYQQLCIRSKPGGSGPLVIYVQSATGLLNFPA